LKLDNNMLTFMVTNESYKIISARHTEYGRPEVCVAVWMYRADCYRGLLAVWKRTAMRK